MRHRLFLIVAWKKSKRSKTRQLLGRTSFCCRRHECGLGQTRPNRLGLEAVTSTTNRGESVSKKSRRKQKYAERQAAIDAAVAKRREEKANEPAPYEVEFVERPFAGMPNEVELVAMRELLPAATLELQTTAEYGDRSVIIATVLPNQVQGLVRKDDEQIMIALQTRSRTRDAGHDLAVILQELLQAEPGHVVDARDLRVQAPRLQEIITDKPGKFEIQKDFGFWLAPTAERSPEADEAIARSAESLVPCEQVEGEPNAFWTRMNADFVRWIWQEDEDRVFDALARLRVREECSLGHGSFFIGAFRSAGLVVPVWEFPERVEPGEIVEGIAQARKLMDEALADDSALSYDERRARAGLVSRQVSLA